MFYMFLIVPIFQFVKIREIRGQKGFGFIRVIRGQTTASATCGAA
jgi:hypothetical protein